MKTGRWVTSRIGDCRLPIADWEPTTVLVLPNFFVPRRDSDFSWFGNIAAFFQFVQTNDDFLLLASGFWLLASNFCRAIDDGLLDDVSNLRDLINAHERIHFGHEFGQFVAKSLRQTAGNDDGLAALVCIAQFDGFKDGVHAFLLRGVNEGAGVDDDGIGLRGVVGDLDAVFQQRAEHDFGVHQIFGAAERNETDAQRLGTGIFLVHRRNRLADYWRVAMLRSNRWR